MEAQPEFIPGENWIERQVSELLDRCYERRDKVQVFVEEAKRLDTMIPKIEKLVAADRAKRTAKDGKPRQQQPASPVRPAYPDLDELAGTDRIVEVCRRNPDGLSGNEVADLCGLRRGSIGEQLRQAIGDDRIRKTGAGPATRYWPITSQQQAGKAALAAAGVDEERST